MGNCQHSQAAVDAKERGDVVKSKYPTVTVRQNKRATPKPRLNYCPTFNVVVSMAASRSIPAAKATEPMEEHSAAAMTRGYSSGASTNDAALMTSSSYVSSSSNSSSNSNNNNNNNNNNNSTSTSTSSDHNHPRQPRPSLLMDPLHLRSMRKVAKGDLTRAVVRLETPYGQAIESIYEGVSDGPFLGEGVAGLVRLVTHRATGVRYACKILDIGLISTQDGLRQLRDEISIMCQLDHPNIVRIEEVYASTDTIYLLQELCLGGDLFERLDEQPDVHYTEAQCAKLVKQMVSAVRYLHSKGVVHRDLK
jgi:hypothetical protein